MFNGEFAGAGDGKAAGQEPLTVTNNQQLLQENAKLKQELAERKLAPFFCHVSEKRDPGAFNF